jgi:hypothetical protein
VIKNKIIFKIKNPVTEATGLVLTKGLGVNLLLATSQTYIRIFRKSRVFKNDSKIKFKANIF